MFDSSVYPQFLVLKVVRLATVSAVLRAVPARLVPFLARSRQASFITRRQATRFITLIAILVKRVIKLFCQQAAHSHRPIDANALRLHEYGIAPAAGRSRQVRRVQDDPLRRGRRHLLGGSVFSLARLRPGQPSQ